MYSIRTTSLWNFLHLPVSSQSQSDADLYISNMLQAAWSYPLYMHKFDARSPPTTCVRSDHFGDPTIPLDTNVRHVLLERLNYWPLGNIEVVCNLRYAGCCFNPITPYFAHVHDKDRSAIQWKSMHVSPFNVLPSTVNEPEYVFSLEGKHKIIVEL